MISAFIFAVIKFAVKLHVPVFAVFYCCSFSKALAFGFFVIYATHFKSQCLLIL